MQVTTHPKFKKHYKKRVYPNPKLNKKFKQRFSLFIKNPNHILLKDHQLKGKQSPNRAFSITGDIRVTYHKIDSNHLILLDIGTHNQVY